MGEVGEIDYGAEILRDSAALAAVAEGNLDAPVAHCPGWDVAELVRHVVGVHRFWERVARERPTAFEVVRAWEHPAPPPDEDLLETLAAGAGRMVATLRAADPATPAWTWAPGEQNVGFILRHQVQEAAVHRWDAENAAGRSFTIPAPAAADAVEEFLTFSVLSETCPPWPGDSREREPLGGSFVLAAADAGVSWTLTDGPVAGYVAFTRGAAAGAPTLRSDASSLLLWLYGRVDLTPDPPAPELIARFRTACSTD